MKKLLSIALILSITATSAFAKDNSKTKLFNSIVNMITSAYKSANTEKPYKVISKNSKKLKVQLKESTQGGESFMGNNIPSCTTNFSLDFNLLKSASMKIGDGDDFNTVYIVFEKEFLIEKKCDNGDVRIIDNPSSDFGIFKMHFNNVGNAKKLVSQVEEFKSQL